MDSAPHTAPVPLKKRPGTVRVSIYLPEDLRRWLGASAALRGVSMAERLAEILREAKDREPLAGE